jgi:hypothetical protein
MLRKGIAGSNTVADHLDVLGAGGAGASAVVEGAASLMLCEVLAGIYGARRAARELPGRRCDDRDHPAQGTGKNARDRRVACHYAFKRAQDALAKRSPPGCVIRPGC